MSEQCAAKLCDSRVDIRCRRNSPHFVKWHTAVAAWMTTDGRLVDAQINWPAHDDEWESSDDGEDES